jgi:hypothetical protein
MRGHCSERRASALFDDEAMTLVVPLQLVAHAGEPRLQALLQSSWDNAIAGPEGSGTWALRYAIARPVRVPDRFSSCMKRDYHNTCAAQLA